jgi:hypothetical protein
MEIPSLDWVEHDGSSADPAGHVYNWAPQGEESHSDDDASSSSDSTALFLGGGATTTSLQAPQTGNVDGYGAPAGLWAGDVDEYDDGGAGGARQGLNRGGEVAALQQAAVPPPPPPHVPRAATRRKYAAGWLSAQQAEVLLLTQQLPPRPEVLDMAGASTAFAALGGATIMGWVFKEHATAGSKKLPRRSSAGADRWQRTGGARHASDIPSGSPRLRRYNGYLTSRDGSVRLRYHQYCRVQQQQQQQQPAASEVSAAAALTEDSSVWLFHVLPITRAGGDRGAADSSRRHLPLADTSGGSGSGSDSRRKRSRPAPSQARLVVADPPSATATSVSSSDAAAAAAPPPVVDGTAPPLALPWRESDGSASSGLQPQASTVVSAPSIVQATVTASQRGGASAGGPSTPLLDLRAEPRPNSLGRAQGTNTTTFVRFAEGEQQVGGIVHNPEHGGLRLQSSSGDFAEWHPALNRAELPFREGDVVGLHAGHISRLVDGAAMVGVISRRALCVGSYPAVEGRAQEGGVVAYLGQVPVRAWGPVEEGERLVPSGRQDGTAVSAAAAAAAAAAATAVAAACPAQVPQVLGIAMVSLQPAGAAGLVQIMITPPSTQQMSFTGQAHETGAAALESASSPSHHVQEASGNDATSSFIELRKGRLTQTQRLLSSNLRWVAGIFSVCLVVAWVVLHYWSHSNQQQHNIQHIDAENHNGSNHSNSHNSSEPALNDACERCDCAHCKGFEKQYVCADASATHCCCHT